MIISREQREKSAQRKAIENKWSTVGQLIEEIPLEKLLTAGPIKRRDDAVSKFGCSSPVPVDKLYTPGPFNILPMVMLPKITIEEAKKLRKKPREKNWAYEPADNPIDWSDKYDRRPV